MKELRFKSLLRPDMADQRLSNNVRQRHLTLFKQSMSFSVPTVNHAIEREFTIEQQYYNYV